MNQQNFFLTIFLGAVTALATGCDDSGNGGTTSTATGTGTGTATSTGTGTGTGKSVLLKADPGGFVAADATGNTLGVQGAWYAYGDNIGDNGMPPGKCQTVGMHTAAECAEVTSPVGPFAPSDATDDQKMCTTGRVEAVIAMDYANQWGAGIGFDFNNPGMGAPKAGFNTTAKNVIGVSFDIDAPPTAGIRVEFPDAATNNKAAAYWKAPPTGYTPSPVKAGTNTILWADVTSPDAVNVPALDKTTIMGIQFHVPSGTAGPYTFCISHFKMLLQ